MAYLTNRFQYLTKNKMFLCRICGSKWSGCKNEKEDQNECFNCKKSGHFIYDCLEMQKKKSKKERSKKEIYNGKLKKSLMETGDGKSGSDKDEEEANLGLMATIASDDEDKELSKLTYEELLGTVKVLAR